MVEGDGKFTVPSATIEFVAADGRFQVRMDVVEAHIALTRISAGKQQAGECMPEVIAWLREKFNIVVTHSEAWVIYFAVNKRFEEFQETIRPFYASPTISTSIPSRSTVG